MILYHALMNWVGQDVREDPPKVKHMVAPRIQHQVTYKKYFDVSIEELVFVFVDVLTKGRPRAAGY